MEIELGLTVPTQDVRANSATCRGLLSSAYVIGMNEAMSSSYAGAIALLLLLVVIILTIKHGELIQPIWELSRFCCRQQLVKRWRQ